jgi:hypothetical protein
MKWKPSSTTELLIYLSVLRAHHFIHTCLKKSASTKMELFSMSHFCEWTYRESFPLVHSNNNNNAHIPCPSPTLNDRHHFVQFACLLKPIQFQLQKQTSAPSSLSLSNILTLSVLLDSSCRHFQLGSP